MAKMYLAWPRDCGPGLCSFEVPLVVCQHELELDAALPLPTAGEISGAAIEPGLVVLEISPLESGGRMAPGYYRLAERQSDPVIQKLLRRI